MPGQKGVRFRIVTVAAYVILSVFAVLTLGVTPLFGSSSQPHAEDVIYAGGPVGRTRMLLLVRSRTFSRGETLSVTAEVSVTSSLDNLTKLAATATAQFHVYAGYAGWSPLQLDSEVARGDWYVMPGDPATLFDTDLKNVWSALRNKDTRSAAEWIHSRQPIYPKRL